MDSTRGVRCARGWFQRTRADALVGELCTALAAARPADPRAFAAKFFAAPTTAAPSARGDRRCSSARVAECRHSTSVPPLRFSRPYLVAAGVGPLAEELVRALAAARPGDPRRFLQRYCAGSTS
eukprot:TRINITY_DN29184_c0_g1_i1.p3 TRINITY_DN29184_c0_g1~~TRINITY_DN29184_c0_g1_i1.p3  ORF type:complete len:138 (+),score=41.54 TRINITY_DN29184_c0_g1_i1:44-415(+)